MSIISYDLSTVISYLSQNTLKQSRVTQKHEREVQRSIFQLDSFKSSPSHPYQPHTKTSNEDKPKLQPTQLKQQAIHPSHAQRKPNSIPHLNEIPE